MNQEAHQEFHQEIHKEIHKQIDREIRQETHEQIHQELHYRLRKSNHQFNKEAHSKTKKPHGNRYLTTKSRKLRSKAITKSTSECTQKARMESINNVSHYVHTNSIDMK